MERFMLSREFHERVETAGGFIRFQRSRKEWAAEAAARFVLSPEQMRIEECSQAVWPWNQALLDRLGPLLSTRILHLGSALGEFSVYLAQRGANVTAVDSCLQAVEISRQIASYNGVDINFIHADLRKDVVHPESIDRVVGISVLHHWSRPDVQEILAAAARALRPGASALFIEGVEDSKVFSAVQNLFPAGRRSDKAYRPSILFRSAWRQWLLRQEERDLSTREFIQAAYLFREVTVRGFGLLARLERLTTRKDVSRHLRILDAHLLDALPSLRRYARTLMVEYVR